MSKNSNHIVMSSCFYSPPSSCFNILTYIHTISVPCARLSWTCWRNDIDGLVHERRNSIANALELHLSCTNPLISSANTCPYFLGKKEVEEEDKLMHRGLTIMSWSFKVLFVPLPNYCLHFFSCCYYASCGLHFLIHGCCMEEMAVYPWGVKTSLPAGYSQQIIWRENIPDTLQLACVTCFYSCLIFNQYPWSVVFLVWLFLKNVYNQKFHYICVYFMLNHCCFLIP